MNAMSTSLRQAVAGLRVLLALTVVLGLAYPLAVFLVGRVVAVRADGSLVEVDGTAVGSRLLGQAVAGDEWFLPRPSAAGTGYDPLSSGASNLGPESQELLALVDERRAEIAVREGVDPAAVPPDAVTASASGLDPHVSPAYAHLQVPRVAHARGLPDSTVRRLVEDRVEGRDLGFIGEARVNVLELDIALQALAERPG